MDYTLMIVSTPENKLQQMPLRAGNQKEALEAFFSWTLQEIDNLKPATFLLFNPDNVIIAEVHLKDE